VLHALPSLRVSRLWCCPQAREVMARLLEVALVLVLLVAVGVAADWASLAVLGSERSGEGAPASAAW
jgi:hypothetical protein